MDTTTLEKANKLNTRIREFSEALNCFEWHGENNEPTGVSTNPRLLIEFDDCDGREQIMLPMNLNTVLIDLLKAEIKREMQITVKEFNTL